MGKSTSIPWCRSTLNLWIGCEEVSPGCDGCYAKATDMRFYQGAHWGPKSPRLRTSAKYWRQPYHWNKQAPTSEFAGRKGFWPVFVNAHSDFFDNSVDPSWREEAWAVIRDNPNLTFLLTTKRIGNVRHMLPPDWGDGWAHVWLISTVVNPEEVARDVPKLTQVPAALHGVSIEPQLAQIDLARIPVKQATAPDNVNATVAIDALRGKAYTELGIGHDLKHRIGWVICGGESRQRGHSPREFEIEWALRLGEACSLAGVPFFMKQTGHNTMVFGVPFKFSGKGEDATEWPVELQRREFPVVTAKTAMLREESL